ncbi:AraC-type DNA-binding protein [Rathayibacter oskolensis]|uniref:AraC-type DNA-binding protein n=1 Tax=Rathayibacter oskolensis TaxID=1891671 RepID=A0A1X7PHP0_9MICO|nr:helix-turn-helix transcriptional regulator [Rathayibacter oskolensis]SMH50988.1 AraC-type DNA-binding protein [Rathayibacter oskolensis]
MVTERGQKVEPAERSGVLHPSNVERFAARWITPAADVREVVDTYWSVEWRLAEDETIDQRIIDHPSVTLSVERGRVVAPFVVSAVRTRAWQRTISGAGDVFALRLRPAGLAVLTDLDPSTLTGERVITAVDHRAHRLLEEIAESSDADGRARRADDLIRASLRERPLTEQGRLANAALDLLTAQPHVRPVSEVARALRTSPRSLQRALALTLGRGPAEVARRVRLQEVVRRLSSGHSSIAAIATDLGYTDQAHLTNEFHAVTGTTPGAYLAETENGPR